MTDEDDRKAPDFQHAAYHEAGHATACLMAGSVNVCAEIYENGDGQTRSMRNPAEDAPQSIRLLMAGMISDWRILGRTTDSPGTSEDHRKIWGILATISGSSEERQDIANALWVEMHTAFDLPDVQATVRLIAEELIVHRHLDDAELRRLAAAAGLRTALPLTLPNV